MTAQISPSSMLAPGDFDIEEASIARKRAILDALMKQNMTLPQGQMIGNHYVAPSWAENLATVATSYLGRKGQDDLDAQENTAKQGYQSGLGDAVSDYMRVRNGGEQVAQGQGPLADGLTMETVKPDPRGAIINAMTSQYKPLQTLGAAELANIGKTQLTQNDILKLADHFEPNSVRDAAINLNPALLKPRIKGMAVDGRVVGDSGDGTFPVLSDLRPKYDLPGPVATGPNGDIIGQREQETGKVAFAPPGTTVNVSTQKKGADAFATAGAEDMVKTLTEGRAQAEKAQAGFESFANAATHIQNIKAGSAADLVLTGKKFLSALGVDDPSITSTEQVKSALGHAVLDNAKTLGSGSGFSDTDRKFLENIVSGKITLDASTLQRAVDIGLANNLNIMHQHDNNVDMMKDQAVADPKMVESYRVGIPHFELPASRFDYSPETRRFTVKTSSGTGASPAPASDGSTVPNAGDRKLTPAEESELNELRKRYRGPQ